MNINWDAVISGETIMVWDEGQGFTDTEFHIIHTFGDSVWFRTNGFGVPLTGHKSDFKHCHIKENKWREITQYCWLTVDDSKFILHYYKNRIDPNDCVGKNRKFKIEWPKVFTCN